MVEIPFINHAEQGPDDYDAFPGNDVVRDPEYLLKEKRWSDTDDKNRARMLYNYLVSRRVGNDIFGKRMGSSFPTKNFRFFTSNYPGKGGSHGSEFLGKRAEFEQDDQNDISPLDFMGKRARVSEFLGKRSKASEFLGKRARVSEFLGKRARVSEFLGKRGQASEFLGKRARVSEFLGKRSATPEPSTTELQMSRLSNDRIVGSETVDKRARVSEFLGKRARVSEFLGKRPDPDNYSLKRTRISEFLGKRGNFFNGWNVKPRTRVSEFLGKRSGGSVPVTAMDLSGIQPMTYHEDSHDYDAIGNMSV